MLDWRKWLLFVLPGFILLLGAITIGVKNYFQLSTSDTLAFAQLVLSLLLLPTVLIGFIITIDAFRKSQELPDLDVIFEDETDSARKSLKFNSRDISDPASKQISLVSINQSNTIALWYAIKLNMQVRHAIPNEFLQTNQASMPELKDHWHVVGGSQMPNKELEAIFLSRGDLPSYPNLPFKFCELVLNWFLPSLRKETREYQISYTIFTDRGNKKQGTLKLFFQVES